jgi:hypothetical protein
LGLGLGFVAAIDRSLLVEASTAPVAACGLLPRRAREHAEPDDALPDPAAGGRSAARGDARHGHGVGRDDERAAYISTGAVRGS